MKLDQWNNLKSGDTVVIRNSGTIHNGRTATICGRSITTNDAIRVNNVWGFSPSHVWCGSVDQFERV